MNWSMPRQTLQIVAGLLAFVALAALVVGLLTAPPRSRLPGERAIAGSALPLEAAEVTPLSGERIEGPPPPPVLSPEERARLEAEKKAKEEAEAAARLAAPAPAATPAAPAPAAPDKVGDLLDSVTPTAEEPPF